MAENVTRIREYSADVRSRIASLETQMVNVAEDVKRIEARVDAQYQQLNARISDFRDEMRTEIDAKHEKLITKLDEHGKRESEANSKLEEKISSMEKWRWMLMGGAVVAGYLIAHLKIEKLL